MQENIKKTLFLDAKNYGTDIYDNAIKTASEILIKGGVAAIPTETVYGLAANALDEDAVAKIFKAKNRPADNPLIVHIDSLKAVYPLVKEFPQKAKILAEHFWPAALTIIMEKSDKIPSIVSGGLDTVALRIPDNKPALDLLKKCGLPLAAPSANLSGRPSPTKAIHVLNDMNGRIEAILDGGHCEIGVESTVISFAEKIPVILRPGKVTKEEIEKIIGLVKLHKAVTDEINIKEKAISPGMKYKHYSPVNPVIIINSDAKDYINFLNEKFNEENNIIALCFNEDIDKLNCKTVSFGFEDDSLSQASTLYDSLIATNDFENHTIYARMPKKQGIGLAVFNRLLRAAGNKIIDIF